MAIAYLASAKTDRPHSALIDCIESPVGIVAVVVRENHLVHCSIGSSGESDAQHWSRRHHLLARPAKLPQVRTALAAYFDGGPLNIPAPLSLAFVSGTDFQRRVWSVLAGIPWQTVTTYGAIAADLHSPRSVRAVGRAVGANPLPLFLPCHRVVGNQGDLTGFSCGLSVKRQLLRIERMVVDDGDRVQMPHRHPLQQATLL